MRLPLLLIATLSLTLGCTKFGKKDTDSSSSLDTIGMTFPAGPYDGYELRMLRWGKSKNDENCTRKLQFFGKINKATNTATLMRDISPNCSYLVRVNLGTFDESTGKLSKVLYTNKSANALGTQMESNQFFA